MNQITHSHSATLIPTFTGRLDGIEQALVDARVLHGFLGANTKFQDWIKRRIEEYQFTQGIDFLVILKNENLDRGFFGWKEIQVQDYHLSLDMAKELCMVERNDQGRQARRYFIDMEKQARLLPLVAAERVAELEQHLARYQALFLQTPSVSQKIADYYARGLSTGDIGKLVGKSPRTVRRLLARLRELNIVAAAPAARRSVAAIGSANRAQQSLDLEG